MSKIIKLRTDTDNVVQFLETVIEEVKKDSIKNMQIACKCDDGSVMMAFTKNIDWRNKTRIMLTFTNKHNK